MDRYQIYELIFQAASHQNHIDEFNYLRYTPSTSASYAQSLNIALDKLQDLGIIKISEDKIISFDENNKSFEQKLYGSDSLAWEISNKFQTVPNIKNKILKYEDTYRKEIGKIGEEKVIEHLKSKLDKEFFEKIEHTALFNDSAGYDIETPSIDDPSRQIFLEVKTSKSPSNTFTFYLSRNECSVALNHPEEWFLVLVKINGEEVDIKHLHISYIEEWIPTNHDPRCRWESVKITLKNFTEQREGTP